jgi:multiple sugar transport system permease protein
MGVIVALAILAYYIALFAIPFGRAIWLSFHNWDFLSDPVYIGTRNYERVVQDDYFWEAVKVTALYAVLRIGIGLTVSFLVALGISQLKERLQRIYLGIYYLPVVIPGVVSIILWRWLYRPADGPLNSVLNSLGIDSQPFLNSTSQALPAIVVMAIWSGLGSSAIIFFAGVNEVPSDLLEAAKLDGAGLRQQTLHIILPLLRPVIFYELIVGVIGAVQAFEVMYLMPGPGFSTRTLALYTYELGFKSLNLGYGATVSIFIFLFLLVATVLQFRRFMSAQQQA